MQCPEFSTASQVLSPPPLEGHNSEQKSSNAPLLSASHITGAVLLHLIIRAPQSGHEMLRKAQQCINIRQFSGAIDLLQVRHPLPLRLLLPHILYLRRRDSLLTDEFRLLSPFSFELREENVPPGAQHMKLCGFQYMASHLLTIVVGPVSGLWLQLLLFSHLERSRAMLIPDFAFLSCEGVHRSILGQKQRTHGRCSQESD